MAVSALSIQQRVHFISVTDARGAGFRGMLTSISSHSSWLSLEGTARA